MKNLKTFIHGFAVCIALTAVFTSCSKNNNEDKFEGSRRNLTSKKGVSTMNIPVYCEDLENPCSDPACAPYYQCGTQPEISVNSFKNSTEFNRFKVNNPSISAKIKYTPGKVLEKYNPVLIPSNYS